MIGFAGQRVSQQTAVMKPPADFQTAEYQFKHGMIDLICPRKELRETLTRLLQFGTQSRIERRRATERTAARPARASRTPLLTTND